MNATDEKPAEDLTLLDALQLHDRIQLANIERDGLARHIANLVIEGDPDDYLPYAKRDYLAAVANLNQLYAENRRRIEARKAVQ